MQATEKLYELNSHLTNCEARVLSCEYDETRHAYAAILDRTVFFPEGGGQLADLGSIIPLSNTSASGADTSSSSTKSNMLPSSQETCCNLSTVHILDVRIFEDVITHYTDQPLPVGSAVYCEIDWGRRFDFMQQHSAEHILSGLVHSIYGYNNVGFHLGLTETTLDFDGSLTPEQISDLELRANQAIWENIPFQITFPDADTLAKLDYRSKKELTGAVRIVTLPGYDVCACCAPHVNLSGEIGMLKIISYMAHRGGMRLTILCGGRALFDYRTKQTSVEQISSLLSAKQPEVTSAVSKTLQDKQECIYRINDLQKMVLDAELRNLPEPEAADDVLLFQKDLDTKAIRNAVNELCTRYNGYCGIFVGDDRNGYTFVLGSITKDCRKAATILREAFSAKGGGSERMIQGSITAISQEIRDTLLSL